MNEFLTFSELLWQVLLAQKEKQRFQQLVTKLEDKERLLTTFLSNSFCIWFKRVN